MPAVIWMHPPMLSGNTGILLMQSCEQSRKAARKDLAMEANTGTGAGDGLMRHGRLFGARVQDL